MTARIRALLVSLLLAACGQNVTNTPTQPAPATAAATATISPLPVTATLAAAATASATTTQPIQQPSPSPTFTQAPPLAPRQLTQGGCCVQPFWSADSREVRYLDRPSSGQPSGIWAVAATGGEPHFVTARLGLYSPDETLVAYPESGQTYVERVGGERWKVPTGGRAILFSPDSTQIAWQNASSTVNFDRRQVALWIAGVDGSGARKVADLVGGGLSGWFPDGQHLLITSRTEAGSQIEALDLANGSRRVLASAARFQGIALSPAGGWLAYSVAFSGEADQDGLYIAAATGDSAIRLDTFGAFAWQAEGRLLVIPLEPEAASNRLLAHDAATGGSQPLTDPGLTPFQIAEGNWALSPDGLRLAFVSAADHNLWVLDLPK